MIVPVRTVVKCVHVVDFENSIHDELYMITDEEYKALQEGAEAFEKWQNLIQQILDRRTQNGKDADTKYHD